MAGGGIGAIGPLMSLAGGMGGGKGGGGGATAQEAALAQFNAGQGQLANMTKQASSGLGASTMATVGNIGPEVGAALSLAQLSDQNQAQQVAGAQQAQQDAAFGAGFGTPANQGSVGSSVNTTG